MVVAFPMKHSQYENQDWSSRQCSTNEDDTNIVDIVDDYDDYILDSDENDSTSPWWAADEYLLCCALPMVSSPRLVGGGQHPYLA